MICSVNHFTGFYIIWTLILHWSKNKLFSIYIWCLNRRGSLSHKIPRPHVTKKKFSNIFHIFFFWRDVKNWTFYSCEKFEKVRDKPGQKFAFKRSVQQVSLITHLKLLSQHVETSQLICRTNWLTGSCIMVKIFQQFRWAV